MVVVGFGIWFWGGCCLRGVEWVGGFVSFEGLVLCVVVFVGFRFVFRVLVWFVVGVVVVFGIWDS